MTQLEKARKNEITKEMTQIAQDENLEVSTLLDRILKGHVVILYNPVHAPKAIGVGYGLRAKVNANIGISSVKSSLENELEKLKEAIDAGADSIMDLSIGRNLDEIRKTIIENCCVPLGTVPIYQAAVESGGAENLSLEKYLEVFEKHARDGVDFATVHAGITKDSLALTEKRIMPIVSRGGRFMADWMTKHNKESFLYEYFDKVLDIAGEYDVTMSLGDALRPGTIFDSTDEAQKKELENLAYLAHNCREKGVQVMIEGPGHIPLEQIAVNIIMEKKICNNAPFYVLGPLPTDIAAGYDHIASAIGATMAVWHGADFICYVTPREHIGLPNVKDVRDGVIASRIAAHIGDIARNRNKARARDLEMSKARTELDWDKMAEYVIDSRKFKELVKEECKDNPEISRYCSMCGPFCTEKKKDS